MKSSKLFYVGIKGIIYNPNTKKVLVLKAVDAEGTEYWDVPGGRVNAGEDIIDTLKREVQEELLGFRDFEVEKLVNVYNSQRQWDNGIGLFLVFYKLNTTTEDFKLSEEHECYRWVGQDELGELDGLDGVNIEKWYLDPISTVLNGLK